MMPKRRRTRKMSSTAAFLVSPAFLLLFWTSFLGGLFAFTFFGIFWYLYFPELRDLRALFSTAIISYSQELHQFLEAYISGLILRNLSVSISQKPTEACEREFICVGPFQLGRAFWWLQKPTKFLVVEFSVVTSMSALPCISHPIQALPQFPVIHGTEEA